MNETHLSHEQIERFVIGALPSAAEVELWAAMDARHRAPAAVVLPLPRAARPAPRGLAPRLAGGAGLAAAAAFTLVAGLWNAGTARLHPAGAPIAHAGGESPAAAGPLCRAEEPRSCALPPMTPLRAWGAMSSLRCGHDPGAPCTPATPM